MKFFDNLVNIAHRKNLFDQTNPWSNGSSTYIEEIKKEVQEVAEEIAQDRKPYLEDELGDVLWDYLNLVLALEKEKGIKLENVLKRASRKYEERVSGTEKGILWKETKEKQKTALAKEYKES
ncbi:MAG: nucleotide pyrophosphohydrolase [Anaerolineae bacterium]|jgi:NTP pyrophosphatase (non-canonical NTP hydrolase)|nr:nucleotide pyrophosphohydrolase [Anaerolineae bacterium]MBT3714026.1 nucleotide pyrophosphohydrolase [Anaerolineae bacterium]MBT4312476.1 nucleotide pyrophosphohydrolase [Anaerolineae bacterium]MBT4458734.1 nucleotide pyrophosphohydrolase [Anaerolineae bacterium]MBT4842256.1 nucleotide pyrophosphohydrolase [Anaerolineae bacterium]